MKKILLILIAIGIVGCSNTNKKSFEEGKYCTTGKNSTLSNSLVLEFNANKVNITNVLSSFKFKEAHFEISKGRLTITGIGLPSNENDEYILNFEIEKKSIVFSEQDSTNFEAFDLKDGNVLTQDCK